MFSGAVCSPMRLLLPYVREGVLRCENELGGGIPWQFASSRKLPVCNFFLFLCRPVCDLAGNLKWPNCRAWAAVGPEAETRTCFFLLPLRMHREIALVLRHVSVSSVGVLNWHEFVREVW